MGEAVLSFDQKTCFDQKTKSLLCFLTKILPKEYFLERTTRFKPYCP